MQERAPVLRTRPQVPVSLRTRPRKHLVFGEAHLNVLGH